MNPARSIWLLASTVLASIPVLGRVEQQSFYSARSLPDFSPKNSRKAAHSEEIDETGTRAKCQSPDASADSKDNGSAPSLDY